MSKQMWLVAFGVVVLAACGGGSGGAPAANSVGIDTSEAQTPSTPQEKRQQLVAATQAFGGFGDFDGFAGMSDFGGLKRAVETGKRLSMGVAKLSPAQMFEDSGEETVDCEDGGTYTTRYSVNANQNGGSSTFEEIYEACDEFGYVTDGSVTVRTTYSAGSDGSAKTDISVALTEIGEDHEYRAAIGITMKMTVEGLEDFTVAQDDMGGFGEGDFESPSFTLELTINGAVSMAGADYDCFNGTYVFDTIEPLVIDENVGTCGFSAGKVKLNGVTYTFSPESISDGENEFSCSELSASDVCEDTGSSDGDGAPGDGTDATDL